jgi:hypothetical protein
VQASAVLRFCFIQHTLGPRCLTASVRSGMRRACFIVVAIGMLLSACRTSQPVAGTPMAPVPTTMNFAPIQAPPARVGEVLVLIGGGPVEHKGEHWFPEGATLATVLDWAGLDRIAPPRNVYLVDPEGNAVRYPVAGRPRTELEQVRIMHGTRIIVPWDRCFGLGPNERGAGKAGIAPLQIQHLGSGLPDRERWTS